jgi:hypothetical protein
MGGSIGVSILGALYAHRVTTVLQEQLGGSTPLRDPSALRPSLLHNMPPDVISALRLAITRGVDGVFGWAAVICSSGIVVALFVRQVALRGSVGDRGGPEPTMAADPAVSKGAAPVVAAPGVVAPAPAIIMGVVDGHDGVGLSGAVITVLDEHGRFRAGAVSCAGGRFAIGGLESGIVSVVVQSDGFRPGVVDVVLAEHIPVWVEIPLESEAALDRAAVSSRRDPLRECEEPVR